MYKNNSRDSRKIKVCSPLQLFCNLSGNCHAIGYYSYTNVVFHTEKTVLTNIFFNTKTKQKRTVS